jgi:DNA-binding NarL/FixJ family response regulator
MPIKVSLVEDNDEIRESLSELISQSPGFECVGSFSNPRKAIAEIPKSDAEVVLMDINLNTPGFSGIECTKQIKEIAPSVQILMLTVYEDSEKIFESLKVGASGYLLKRTAPARLFEAIEEVHKGGSPMTSQIARMVVESFRNPATERSDDLGLSKREMEILDLLSKGYRYKEISESLFISLDTVRSHVRNIYDKLHVRSRTEAVVKFLKK